MDVQALAPARWKWLLLVLPLVLSGCGEGDDEQARELRTRLDEAQARIGAQSARIASLERRLAAAAGGARRDGKALQPLLTALKARTRELRNLRRQHQARLLQQRNLRQALAQAGAAAMQLNQQLLALGQQNSFLRERIRSMDSWIRQYAASNRSLSRELAQLRGDLRRAREQGRQLGKLTAERDHLKSILSQRDASLARARTANSDLQARLQSLDKAMAGNLRQELKLKSRIADLQRARAYLADKLAAAGDAEKRARSRQAQRLGDLQAQLQQRQASLASRDQQHQRDQQAIADLKAALAAEKENTVTSETGAGADKGRQLAECQRQAQADADQITALRKANLDMGKMAEANLRQIGELLQKLSACPASPAPN